MFNRCFSKSWRSKVTDAHDAYCQLSIFSAVTKRGPLGWKGCCREALEDFGGDARSSPPAESGFASEETRRVCINLTLRLPTDLIIKDVQ